ncbi:MAG: hypothetical protein IT293_11540 [Deltaproteobacteria bacterium]|nr:hypothetical protein [Deltaproteobacteria bacterium]
MRHSGGVDGRPERESRSASRLAATTILLAVGFIAAVVSRRPSTLSNAQFWAEDGALFYVQARELGFPAALGVPYAGYLLTMPRLVASVSPFLPLAKVPLMFNLVALLMHALPAIYLASARMRSLGPLSVRVLLGVLYVGVPNVATVHGNLCNAQWHLAILCFLIVVAAPPASLWAAAFDVTALALGALTGPFALFLLPIAVAVAWVRRDRWTMARAGILIVGAAVLPLTLATSARPKSIAGLGASVAAFCQLFAFQVVGPTFRGINTGVHYLHPPWKMPLVSCTVTGIAFAMLAYVFRRGGLEVRCFLVFAALMLAAALANPAASAVEPQWVVLQRPGSPPRYWFVPELAIAAAVVSLACTASTVPLRLCAAALVGVMLVADLTYWRLPGLPDRGFARYVAAFEALPVGAQMGIAIPPNWTFKITKTARD